MSILLNGDCLNEMKELDDNSIDLIFCDLPYGQTSCKWDCKIDLNLFWKEVMRIKKLNTPIFFTTTARFGIDIITSAPKKCPFRFDLVWVKSSPTGFLNAKKMPMRKHELVYVFYEKLPFYDLSSHKHKFLKENTPMGDKPDMYGRLWDKDGKPYVKEKQHSQYNPPLPVSVVKEEKTQIKKPEKAGEKNPYGDCKGGTIGNIHGTNYDPPLPTTILRTDEGCNGLYGKEEKKVFIYDENGRLRNSEPRYDPPLPTTLLEIKSTKGKHATEKPVALMEWILKYYSKEGDVILDPTMGSGSTGVACKNMNRNFIGIEMDSEIYEVAVNRIEK